MIGQRQYQAMAQRWFGDFVLGFHRGAYRLRLKAL
jgi:hypothetical protein